MVRPSGWVGMSCVASAGREAGHSRCSEVLGILWLVVLVALVFVESPRLAVVVVRVR